MKRVSVVVAIALLNALLFGVTGSASPVQIGPQNADMARQDRILRDARRMQPGRAIRVERLDGTKVEGLWDRVNADGDIEILKITKGHRETVIIPVGAVRRLSPIRGRGLKKFAVVTGVTVAVLLGACAGLVAAASAGSYTSGNVATGR